MIYQDYGDAGSTHSKHTKLGLFGQALAVLVICLGWPTTVMALDGATLARDGNGESVPACASCHGTNGEGQPESAFPRLAGLNSGYLLRQLRQIRKRGPGKSDYGSYRKGSGRRIHGIRCRILRLYACR